MPYKHRFAPFITSGDLHLGNLRCLLLNANEGSVDIRIDHKSDDPIKYANVKNLFLIIKLFKLNVNRIYKLNLYCEKNLINRMKSDKKNFYETKRSLRLRLPNINIEWNDLIFGKRKINLNSNEDVTLLKSDGTSTYMLSSIVNDVQNDYVILRGIDHMINAAVQLYLCDILKLKRPIMGHIPLTYWNDEKMSKRNSSISVLSMIYEHHILPSFISDYLNRKGVKNHLNGLKTSNISRSEFNINGKTFLKEYSKYVRELNTSLALQEIYYVYKKRLNGNLFDICKRNFNVKRIIEIHEKNSQKSMDDISSIIGIQRKEDRYWFINRMRYILTGCTEGPNCWELIEILFYIKNG